MQQSYGARNPDNTARFSLQCSNGFLRGLGFHHHRFTVLVEGLPDLGHRKLSGCSVDKPHAKAFLELRYPAA
ncbi:UNVERIFIED_ORG: hypothetical protein J2X95_000134 [Enterobacter mori]|nr:hypothetical protein [Enterobacter mori]MDP9658270.1 hypothetical protein [Enterobacter mori]